MLRKINFFSVAVLGLFFLFSGSVSAENLKPDFLNGLKTRQEIDKLTDQQKTQLGDYLKVNQHDRFIKINSVAVNFDKEVYTKAPHKINFSK
ncbi:MAG: hypothetical protein WCJ51_03770 [Candidatus Moraniibacteriota bacterium]